MSASNVITVIGRAGADPETRSTQGGSNVTTVRVAVSRTGKDKDTTDWFEVRAFGRVGEVIAQYVRKGSQLAVSGTCQIDQWTGNDGSKRTTVRIIASGVHLLGSRDDQPATKQAAKPATKAASPWDDDDIPAF